MTLKHAILGIFTHLLGCVCLAYVISIPRVMATAQSADLLLKNGKIYTVEPTQPWAESLAVKDGKLVAVGTNDTVSNWQGEHTKVIDLAGRLVMPAFLDAHIHPVLGGLSYTGCTLLNDTSIEGYQRTIKKCVQETPGDGVIYGRGWLPGLFPPDGIPRKAILDAISSERPLIFNSTGGHSLWLNSAALKLAGISKETPAPENGRIDKDPDTGELLGGLQEAAMALVAHLIPTPNNKQMQDAIVYTASRMNQWGITGWLDAGITVEQDGNSPILDAYIKVSEQSRMAMHVVVALKWQNDSNMVQTKPLLMAAQRAEQAGINARSIKFYLDGVLVQQTAAVLEPYLGNEGGMGHLQIEPKILQQAFNFFHQKEFQIYTHAIGDRAVRVALDAIEMAQNNHKNLGKGRHVISHLNLVSKVDQTRFGPLGVAANFQPLWAYNHDYMNLTAQQVGEARMAHTYPSKSILLAGGPLAFGADWPVDSANPFAGLEVAVTRREPGNPEAPPLYEDEAISLEQAVYGYTMSVARVMGIERLTGSLTPGKNADLILVDQNIFEVDPYTIASSKVQLTLFNGLVVHGDWP